MSVVNRTMQTATSAVTGFGQGFQPVCGFNYGAKLYDRVIEGFWFCFKVAAVVLTSLSLLGIIFAPEIIAVVRNDPDVIEIGALALRLRCAVYPLMCWYIPSNMMLQTMGRTGPATFLAISRQGIFLIPALLILTPLLKLLGIQAAQPAFHLGIDTCFHEGSLFLIPDLFQLYKIENAENEYDGGPEDIKSKK